MTDALAYPPKLAAEVAGVAYTRLRAAIEDGELEVRYPSPKRAVITRTALQAWLESLPSGRETAGAE